MCIRCGNLIKAIDAYIAKADSDLAATLGDEGYIEPQETVEAISSLEERVAAALLSETDYIIEAVNKADSLAQFQMDIWPKLKEGDTLQDDLQAIFSEEFGDIVRRFAGLYFDAIENGGSVTKASVERVRVSKQTTAWVQDWSQELAGIMKLNSHKEIESILTDGLEGSVGIPEFARNIMNSGIRDEWYKARRVAVTEVLTAHRAGQQEAYLQSPSTSAKMWRHTGIYINGPRQNHKDMNGRKVPKDQPFELLGADGTFYHPMYPGDTSLPPEERIECHCTTQGIVDEDVLGLPLEERQRLQQEAIDELDEKWEAELEAKNKAMVGYKETGTGGQTEIYQPMGSYIGPDGSFNLDAAKEDYRNFLQSVPEKNRMYLEQSLDAVGFEQTKLKASAFGYSAKKDSIVYDPSHPMFSSYDFRTALTHELGHRIDRYFVHSTEQSEFVTAIQGAEEVFTAEPDFFAEYCEQKDMDGFLSDIMSAICKGRYRIQGGHRESYWTSENQAREIFANLFGMEAYDDAEKLALLEEYFHDLMKSFHELEFQI